MQDQAPFEPSHAAGGTAPPPPPPQALAARLVFDGTGSEYFRIWIVHALLTLLTLGVYSAWAKVRKARWFAQHTSLLGDRFDYHGAPWRILLGRALALALVLAWSYAFDLSLWFGLAMLALLCVAGPPLLASAQRFKLANTSWRGLRFGYAVPRTRVYAVVVPVLLLWASSSVVFALGASTAWFGAAGIATLLALPWAHERLKRLQHAHARYGSQRFVFEPAAAAFYSLYGKAVLLGIVGVAIGFPLAGLLAGLARDAGQVQTSQGVLSVVLGAAMALLTWTAAWPYFAARMQQVVWSHTRCGALRFRGDMKGGTLWRLVLGQTGLVLLTAGLYWPFAAVAVARYRVQSLVLVSDEPLAEVLALAQSPREAHAAGDAADFFGLDLGW